MNNPAGQGSRRHSRPLQSRASRPRRLQLLALAKQYTKAVNPNSPTKYGDLVTAPTGGPEAPKIFCTVLWVFEGNVLNENGKGVVNSDATVKAGEVYREFRTYLPEDATTGDYPKVLDGA